MSANLDNQNQYIGFQEIEKKKRAKSLKKEVLWDESKTIEFKTRSELRWTSLKKEVFWELWAETIDVKVSVKSELDKKLESHFDPNHIKEQKIETLKAIWIDEDLLARFVDALNDVQSKYEDVFKNKWLDNECKDYVVWVINDELTNLIEKNSEILKLHNQTRVTRAIQPILFSEAA